MAKMISKKVKAQFANAETLGDLRKAYLEAMMYYSTPSLMERVNTLYIDKFEEVKNLRRSQKGKVYKKKEWNETVSFFLNAVNTLKGIEGIDCEMRGDWLFVTGDTKPVKEGIKSAGCFFNPKQKCWCIGA